MRRTLLIAAATLSLAATGALTGCQSTRQARLCDRGDIAACVWVAQSVEDTDAAAAQERYWQACEHGGSGACVLWALREAEADRVDAAYEQLITSCDDDESTACRYAGLLRLGFAGLSDDEALARAHFDRGCELGGADSCLLSGVFRALEIGGEDTEGDARGRLELACNLRSYDACRVLAYVEVQAGERTLAERRLRTACGQQHAPSCHQLGHLAQRTDLDAALELFEEACAGGVLDACDAREELLVSRCMSIVDNPDRLPRDCEGLSSPDCMRTALLAEGGCAPAAIAIDLRSHADALYTEMCTTQQYAPACGRHATVLAEASWLQLPAFLPPATVMVPGEVQRADLQAAADEARRTACDVGDARSCILTVLSHEGEPALGFMRAACESGYGPGCDALIEAFAVADPGDWRIPYYELLRALMGGPG